MGSPITFSLFYVFSYSDVTYFSKLPYLILKVTIQLYFLASTLLTFYYANNFFLLHRCIYYVNFAVFVINVPRFIK